VASLLWKVSGKGAAAKLNALQAAAANMQPIFAVIGSRIANRIRLCFKLGIDPWGNPWQALKFRKGQPLRDTGRLQRSIVSKPDASGVTVGTNVLYAPTHQFGAEIFPVKAKRLVFPGPNGRLIFAKKVKIPARPFMPLRRASSVVVLPPSWSEDVVRALKTYFKKAAEAATVGA
jgi:phage gpG-like protein